MKRTMFRTAAALLAAVLFLPRCLAAEPQKATRPAIHAQSAILMDAGSGRVLFEHNADARSRIASTTKILTGLLICEQMNPEQEITVPKAAAGVEGSSMYLMAGERITVRELLYGLLLHSGNDAATALAIVCDGTMERFVERMNARAAQLGMTNSHFRNPSGLDEDGHFSTARDLALLTQAALRNALFREAVGTKSISLGSRTLTNHNRLLWSYPGANGVKTGYTRAAGRVLVSSAERGGRTLIAVTICDPNDWADHTALLDYGFSAFEWRCFLRAGESAGAIPVVGGVREAVTLRAGEALNWPLAPGETAELRLHAPQFVYAPVLNGPAGYAELLVDGKPVRRVTVYYRHPVAQIPEKGLLGRLFGG